VRVRKRTCPRSTLHQQSPHPPEYGLTEPVLLALTTGMPTTRSERGSALRRAPTGWTAAASASAPHSHPGSGIAETVHPTPIVTGRRTTRPRPPSSAAITGQDGWPVGIDRAAAWFMGSNDGGEPLYDAGSGGCDGAGPPGLWSGWW
jgi:hypothetical protein